MHLVPPGNAEKFKPGILFMPTDKNQIGKHTLRVVVGNESDFSPIKFDYEIVAESKVETYVDPLACVTTETKKKSEDDIVAGFVNEDGTVTQVLMSFGDDGSYVPTDANGKEVEVPSYWVTSSAEDDKGGDEFRLDDGWGDSRRDYDELGGRDD